MVKVDKSSIKIDSIRNGDISTFWALKITLEIFTFYCLFIVEKSQNIANFNKFHQFFFK